MREYSKEFEKWYGATLVPMVGYGELYSIFKEQAWKGWKAGRAKLKKQLGKKEA